MNNVLAEGGLPSSPTAGRARGAQRGVVLVWALLTVFLVAGIVLATSDEMQAVDKQASFEFSVKGQVEEVAQAGLIDAVAWFRRQTAQPVTRFNPKGLPPSLRPAYSLPPQAKLPPELLGLIGIGDEVRISEGGTQAWITDPVTGAEKSVQLNEGEAVVTSTDASGKQVKEVVQVATPDGVKNYRVRTENGSTQISYELNGQVQSFEYDASSQSGLPAGLKNELAAADYYSLSTIDSETPELGLVRTYELTPEIWARYTVYRGTPSEPFSDGNGNGVHDNGETFNDLNGDGRWSAGMHSRDVGRSRGMNASGAIWYITSLGEIFRRPRADLALGDGPNTRLAMSLWGIELRRLTISAPASAALCVQDGSRCRIGPRTIVRGATAIAFSKEGGDPSLKGGKLEGNLGAMPDFSTSYDDVFGVPWTRLMSMADISTSSPRGALPIPLPSGSLIVIGGDVKFDASQPLRGDAIVVVRGNCTIERGSNSFFTGVLYVDGDLSISGPALMRGTTIVTGACDIRGLGSEAVELEHDGSIVSELLSRIGQYRPAKAPFRVRDKVDGAP